MTQSPLEVRWMTIAEAWDNGLPDMVEDHYTEVPASGLPLDVDWPQYRRMERIGSYRPIGAFDDDGKMVGYSAFFVQPTMQHRSSVQAINDVLYLKPSHRRGLAGARLITRAEPLLRALGATRIVYFSHPGINLDRSSTYAKLARLLTRLGYNPVETAHSKML